MRRPCRHTGRVPGHDLLEQGPRPRPPRRGRRHRRRRRRRPHGHRLADGVRGIRLRRPAGRLGRERPDHDQAASAGSPETRQRPRGGAGLRQRPYVTRVTLRYVTAAGVDVRAPRTRRHPLPRLGLAGLVRALGLIGPGSGRRLPHRRPHRHRPPRRRAAGRDRDAHPRPPRGASGTYLFLAVRRPVALAAAVRLARRVVDDVDATCSRFRADSDLTPGQPVAGGLGGGGPAAGRRGRRRL